MSNQLKPITDPAKIQTLAETEGISNALARQFFMQSASGDVFIKRPGLLYKTERKFKGIGYSVRVEVPTKDELETLRGMMGIDSSAPHAIMRGVVETNDGQRYDEYGTATHGNTNSTTREYLLEMACTRATNRAMRVATVSGFTSVDELPPSMHPRKVAPVGKVQVLAEVSSDEPPEAPETISDADYKKLLDLETEYKVVPWHFMNWIKKYFGYDDRKQIEVKNLAEIQDVICGGKFSEEGFQP